MVRSVRCAVFVMVAALAIGTAGCGSTKKTSSNASGSSGSSSSAGHYHRGEFCSKRKQSVYKQAGYKCKKVNGTYRLQ